MRVIAGSAAGIRLASPRGGATRPIADRVKETLFAILAPRLAGARVLDLYAGSGAIGIEALSRGAQHATFVERHPGTAEVIRDNLRRTGLAAAGSVVVGDVARVLAGAPPEPIDLAVLDPPYADDELTPVLVALRRWLAPGAVVVVKHFWRAAPAAEGLETVRTRRFGETALSFIAQRDGAAADDRGREARSAAAASPHAGPGWDAA